MPLSGTGSALGSTLATSAGSVDAPGQAAWTAMGTTLASWIVANCSVLPGTMVAAGAACTGIGLLTFAGAASLGSAIASAAGSVDAVGQAKWTDIATALVGHLGSFGQANPVAFVVSNPTTGGPVTGVGTVTFANTAVGSSLASAAGSIDAAGIAAWTAIGTALLAHVAANAQLLATPIGFIAPPGGGPLTGSGTIT